MKTSVLIILLLAAALSVAYFVFSKPAYPMTQDEAKAYFLEDLKEKYPAADVREVTDILNMTNPDGSQYYQLKATVTNGLSTPCPERINVLYVYPPKNFVSQPPEYITKGCQICLNEPVCTIAFPEEAIIASHTYPGAEQVAAFIQSNSDAEPSASFADTYGNYTDVWLVKWVSASSGKGYQVALSRGDNKVIEVTATSSS